MRAVVALPCGLGTGGRRVVSSANMDTGEGPRLLLLELEQLRLSSSSHGVTELTQS